MTDHYQMLGVAPTASAAEIRQAYARLARERHPDRFTDPAEKQRAQSALQDITTAFNELVNPRSRQEYDESRHKPQSPGRPRRSRATPSSGRSRSSRAGRLEEAVTLLRTAVHHAPDQAAYHAALGRALARVPQRSRARRSRPSRGRRSSPRRARPPSPTSPRCSPGRG